MCVPPHSRRPRTDYWLVFSTRADGHRYIVLKIMSVFATRIEIRQLCHEVAVARSMVVFQKSDQAGICGCVESAHGACPLPVLVATMRKIVIDKVEFM